MHAYPQPIVFKQDAVAVDRMKSAADGVKVHGMKDQVKRRASAKSG